MRIRWVPLHGLACCATTFLQELRRHNRLKLRKTVEQVENVCAVLSKASDLPFVAVIRVFAGSVRVPSEPVPPPEFLLLWQECQNVRMLGESFFGAQRKPHRKSICTQNPIFVSSPQNQALERVSHGRGVSTFALNWVLTGHSG